jgi:uncharacterized membrane protein YbhN (UPF0104 family)
VTRGTLFRVIAGTAILVLVAAFVDVGEVLMRLGSADPGWVAAAMVALTVQTALSALRWRLTAARLGLRLSRRRAVSEYYLSQLGNQLLPGGVLGDVGRAARARGNVGLLRAGASVALERLAGQAGLGAVTLGMLALSLLVPLGVVWNGSAVALALALGAVPLLLLVLPVRWGRHGSARRFVRRALVAPAVRWRQLALSLATAGLNVSAVVFCAQATGTGASLLAVAAIAPLMLGAMLIPASIAGWGVREGAAAALWPLIGATPAIGAAASAAFGLSFLAATAAGAACFAAIGAISALRAGPAASARVGRDAGEPAPSGAG